MGAATRSRPRGSCKCGRIALELGRPLCPDHARGRLLTSMSGFAISRRPLTLSTQGDTSLEDLTQMCARARPIASSGLKRAPCSLSCESSMLPSSLRTRSKTCPSSKRTETWYFNGSTHSAAPRI
jgi:hypothetical protein